MHLIVQFSAKKIKLISKRAKYVTSGRIQYQEKRAPRTIAIYMTEVHIANTGFQNEFNNGVWWRQSHNNNPTIGASRSSRGRC